MKIAIREENREKLQALLDKVQARRADNDISVNKIFAIADEAEAECEDRKLPESYRSGAVFEFSAAGPSASSYGYPKRVTELKIQRGAKGWFVINVELGLRSPKARRIADLYVSQDQADRIREISTRGLHIVKPQAQIVALAA
jgi:hypothetical protein